MKDPQKNRSFVVMFSLIFFFLCFLAFVGFIFNTAYNSYTNKKNKEVYITTNSLGCKKYAYNYDFYWRCPVELELTGLDEEGEGEVLPVLPLSK